MLLADDHTVVRMGIATVLNYSEGFVVAGEADNGLEAVKLARELKPDVVLMDLQMPELGGAEATAQIRAENPEVKILVLTSFATSVELKRAMDAGASGALEKNSSCPQIIDAIRDVAEGRHVISDEIRNSLNSFSSMPEMSPRKIEILNLLAKGFSNKEIAKIIDVAPATVKDHLEKIFKSLNASTRAEAVSAAINLGLITG
ncbi:MAG: response regulator transcription factor [Kiritimatiellae bacterium]|nr:response regulator transcription factor [Kiritimatiellia bacterium]